MKFIFTCCWVSRLGAVLFIAFPCFADSVHSIKEEIKERESMWEKAEGSAKNELAVGLAKLYYKDQNLEKSFTWYLSALEDSSAWTVDGMSDEEAGVYEKAIQIYLSYNASNAGDAAQEILKEFGPIHAAHPEYRRLALIIAVSYANTNRFNDFFDLFYSSVQHAPNHFLVHKTKATLHLKLFERCLPGADKTAHQLALVQYLKQASGACPFDASLYRTMLTFAPEESRASLFIENLNKIIDGNIIIPRCDVEFYIKEALAADEEECAQKLLEMAKKWYKQSRLVNHCQELISHKKNHR